jgi:HEAT repeat protein
MDIPAKKLARLLRPDQPADVRAAAALVLGELGVRDPDVLAEIVDRLSDDSGEVRVRAIRAVGQLKADKALPALLERITHGGEEANLAAEAAVKLGPKAVKALQEMLHKVVPGVRRYIAAALTTTGAAGADAAGVAVLLDPDPQVAAAAAAAITGKIPAMPADRRATLVEELVAVASDKKKPLPASAEVPVVRVLAALGDPAAADVLWARTAAGHPPEVRAAALQAVGKWAEKPSKDQWTKLFAAAADVDFRVAAPALMVLHRLPVADKQLADWVGLLRAPDVAALRLAVEKVGDRDAKDVAVGLMALQAHPDRGLRDAARTRLGKSKAGRAALTEALQAAGTADEAWQAARAVAPFARELSAELTGAVFAAACDHLEAADHRADAFLFLLREADPGAVREQLFGRAVALRKKKKYATAMIYLKTVARDPSVGFGVRLELALCGLKVSGKGLDAADRAGDPCLRSFGTLLEQDADQLRKEVESAKWLEPEELFYVGFHFAEQVGRGRAFGAEVLKLVLKRSPKGELAKSAKNKLKSTGLS